MNVRHCIKTDQLDDSLFKFNAVACDAYARNVVKDFNPIHNHLAKNYCVPGDLIFALMVERGGVHGSMRMDFLNRVGKDSEYIFVSGKAGMALLDRGNKVQAQLIGSGDASVCVKCISAVSDAVLSCTSSYFPYKMMRSLRAENLMLSGCRSLVILKSIEVNVSDLHFASDLTAVFCSSSLRHSGRRGTIDAHFQLVGGNGQVLGQVIKTALIIGIERFNGKRSAQYLENYESLVRMQVGSDHRVS